MGWTFICSFPDYCGEPEFYRISTAKTAAALLGLQRVGQIYRLATARRIITGKLGDARLESPAAQYPEQRGETALPREIIACDQKIPLAREGHKIEAELARRGFDRKSGIGNAACNHRRDRAVGEFLGRVTVNTLRRNLLGRQQRIEQQAGTGALLAVHEAYPWAGKIAQALDAFGVAARHYQALLAVEQVNDLNRFRLEPLAIAERLIRQEPARHVEARDFAGAARKRLEAFEAALEVQFEAQMPRLGKLAQGLQREVVAGMQHQRGGPPAGVLPGRAGKLALDAGKMRRELPLRLAVKT